MQADKCFSIRSAIKVSVNAMAVRDAREQKGPVRMVFVARDYGSLVINMTDVEAKALAAELYAASDATGDKPTA